MGLFTGKKGLVFGIANDRSIAWGITQKLHEEGAEMGFTHLPDKDPAHPKMENRLRKLVQGYNPKVILPCDVGNEEHLDKVFAAARETYGKIDFLVHSIAFASTEDLKQPGTIDCSRAGFNLAMETSVYSLCVLARRAREILNPGGSILTLSYLGGERVVPGYNIMGVCKAALERLVEYLAFDLGALGIRCNAISAGPIKTLSASAVADLDVMFKLYEKAAPLRRNVTQEEVGKSALYLLSDLASGVTGEVLHVDAGYHIMGAPPPSAGLGS